MSFVKQADMKRTYRYRKFKRKKMVWFNVHLELEPVIVDVAEDFKLLCKCKRVQAANVTDGP